MLRRTISVYTDTVSITQNNLTYINFTPHTPNPIYNLCFTFNFLAHNLFTHLHTENQEFNLPFPLSIFHCAKKK
jgi:hypothetical protein